MAQGEPERPWWTFVPAEQRQVYQRSGFSRPDTIRGRSALLVIDCTRAFVGSRPLPVLEAIEEFHTSCGQAAWESLPAIRRLLAAFRGARLPVVFTRADPPAQIVMGGATRPVADRLEDLERMRRGNEFVPEYVEPSPDEWVCEKVRASAFHGTPLACYLTRQGVRSVVVAGCTTSGCVRASAVDCFSAGFATFVAEEACFDRALHPHLANLFDLHAKYAAVLTTDQVLEQLASAAATQPSPAVRS